MKLLIEALIEAGLLFQDRYDLRWRLRWACHGIIQSIGDTPAEAYRTRQIFPLPGGCTGQAREQYEAIKTLYESLR